MKKGPNPNIDAESSIEITDFLPETWSEISKYLDEKDLARLQGVCKLFYHKFSENSLWQPLLNRLRAIDSRISVTLLKDASVKIAFVLGFFQLEARLVTEITLIRALHKGYIIDNKYPLLEKIDLNVPLTLAQLEGLNIELDELNIEIIKASVNKQLDNQANELYLTDLTRLPKAIFEETIYQDFWENLNLLDCSNCFFDCLPNSIDKLKNLESLVCNSSGLQSLPNTIGKLQSLKRLECRKNKLKSLPDTIGELQALIYLDVADNLLHSLPETVGELRALNYLYLNNNELQSLPDTLAQLQALIELYCENNHLQSLPEGLITELGVSWAEIMLASQKTAAASSSEQLVSWTPNFMLQTRQENLEPKQENDTPHLKKPKR